MHPQIALQILSERLPEMKRRFDVDRLSLFGSTARGEARPDSDIDLIVEFCGPATFDNFMGLKLYLEDLLGTRVDLATPRSIRSELKEIVEKDLIRVA